MLIELKEETWEFNAIPRIEKKLGKKYVKEINDRFYIDLDDLYNLLGLLEDEYDYASDKLSEFSNELDRKAIQQEEIWEGKRQ